LRALPIMKNFVQ